MFLANVRFLAGYRRPWPVPPEHVTDAVLAVFRPGDTFAALAGCAGVERGLATPAGQGGRAAAAVAAAPEH